MSWHGVIERAVDRNPVAASLIRIGDPDTAVTISVAPIQFVDTAEMVGGNAVQQTRRWMIPARRLEATGFPVPPVPGDMLYIPMLGEEMRIEVSAHGIAGGEVVRWDVTVAGPQT